ALDLILALHTDVDIQHRAVSHRSRPVSNRMRRKLSGQRKRARDLLPPRCPSAFESMEDPMPDQAYRYVELTSAQAEARRLLADRALGGASTNELRAIVDRLVEIDRELVGVVASPTVQPPCAIEIDAHVTAFDEA